LKNASAGQKPRLGGMYFILKQRANFFQVNTEGSLSNHFFFLGGFFLGLVLPCEPRKIFPFLVFLSPLPIE